MTESEHNPQVTPNEAQTQVESRTAKILKVAVPVGAVALAVGEYIYAITK